MQASEEITSDDKVEVKDVITVSSEPTLPDQETSSPVEKPQDQIPPSNTTTTIGKPASVRPAPVPYGGTAAKSSLTKFGRKGKRKIDSGQGTSATKKSKG